MAEQLRSLRAKRGKIKGQLTRFNNYVNEFDQQKSIVELKLRLDNIENALREFDMVQMEIEILDENESLSGDREEFENSYYSNTARAKEIIAKSPADSNSAVLNASPNNSMQNSDTVQNLNIKLPTIKLPEFNGKYEEWLQYFDTFEALINNNEALTDIQKFYYLKSSLKGEAAQVIQSLQVSGDNYRVAWDLLKERFENKRVIVQAHVKALFDLPAIGKESHQALRKLIDEFLKNLGALKNLGQPTSQWDTLLIFIVSSKLDTTTKREWEKIAAKNESPNLTEFTAFLKERCQMLETIDANCKTYSQDKRDGSFYKKERLHSHISTQNIKCSFCSGSHFIYHCQNFLKLSVKNRLEEAKKLRICTNCLRCGHFNSNCNSRGCKTCNKRHSTLLHLDNSDKASNTQDNSPPRDTTRSENEPSINTHCMQKRYESQVILSTALIKILDKDNKPVVGRALLDSGSQSNFITRGFLIKLGLHDHDTNVPVAGINKKLTNITSITHATVQSLHNAFKRELSFLVLNKITEKIPCISFDQSKLNIPDNITLADPCFYKSNEIDLLLGAGIFYELLCVGQIKTGLDQPILQKSKLGWIISGPLPIEEKQMRVKSVCHLVTNENLLNQLESFWKIEECATKDEHTAEERECERHFMKNYTRNESGRFVVTLPLKNSVNELGDSKANAIRRFYALERRFEKQPDLKQRYAEFMSEYEALGHMSKIDKDKNNNTEMAYYIPHLGVVREDSLTTKLRVVYDASAKTTSGKSLNDILMVGPSIQDELFCIIIRFRKHKFVITADVAKMYRQIEIVEQQRDLQRIVWRADPDLPLEHYVLNTVTYGTAPAAFLAARTLHQLAFDYQSQFPEASKIILKDFYMDDLITGANTIENAIKIKRDVSFILNSAGFQLRKWASNAPTILHESHIDGENDVPQYIITDHAWVKTLGLLWRAKSDTLQFSMTDDPIKRRVTKRTILSEIARIFDPLGLIGPVITKGKLILQQLWQLKIGWDESVPYDLHTAFVQFRDQMSLINKLEIPRHAIIANPIHVRLHGFSDASEKAYGACIYLQSADVLGNNSCRLLCSKSRVAPLRSITLPRLELCGALLLAQLFTKTKNALDMNITSIHLWCDSTIVLSWLAAQPTEWKTFIANRVSEIQRLTKPNYWHHVSSNDNPADVISRGAFPEALIQCDLWWSGPPFLDQSSDHWPSKEIPMSQNIPEKRKIINSLAVTIDVDIIAKFSSLSRLQRVIAYCLRFIKNSAFYQNSAAQGASRQCGCLTAKELNDAMITLIKMVQRQEFFAEFHSLKKCNTVPKNSKAITLNPFLDTDGIIRVGGRLSKAQINPDQKHPVLIPAKHHFTILIIRYEHIRNLHAGPQATLAAIRNRFWPLCGKNAVKKVLRECITCFKTNPPISIPLMGNLPEHRLTPIRPFYTVGVDFAGPFLIKDGKARNRKIVKCYLCIFVCFATKAVHCELAGDLSTDCFLNVLKRFVSRRGICKNIYSDNGTNFIGAKNELRKVHNTLMKDNKIISFLDSNSIIWHLIPPRAPHFGGLWEAAVKSAKYHLKRILGNGHLTFEEFNTLITQIEAVLNSRPLVALSTDPNDLTPLCPSHFLIGDMLNAIPQADVRSIAPNRLNQYRRLQQLLQHFWSRWHREYLSQLQTRSKWNKKLPDLYSPGKMVILHDDNTPPQHWPLGRITQQHPGDDGIVRVVSVRTVKGVVKRSVAKVSVLPIETDN